MRPLLIVLAVAAVFSAGTVYLFLWLLSDDTTLQAQQHLMTQTDAIYSEQAADHRAMLMTLDNLRWQLAELRSKGVEAEDRVQKIEADSACTFRKFSARHGSRKMEWK